MSFTLYHDSSCDRHIKTDFKTFHYFTCHLGGGHLGGEGADTVPLVLTGNTITPTLLSVNISGYTGACYACYQSVRISLDNSGKVKPLLMIQIITWHQCVVCILPYMATFRINTK